MFSYGSGEINKQTVIHGIARQMGASNKEGISGSIHLKM